MSLSNYGSSGDKQQNLVYSEQYDYQVIVSIDDEELAENQFVSLYTMEDYLEYRHTVQVLALRLHVQTDNDLFKKLMNSDSGNTCKVHIDMYRKPNSGGREEQEGGKNASPYVMFKTLTKQAYLDPINIDFNPTDLKIAGLDEGKASAGDKTSIKFIRMALFEPSEFACLNKKAVINNVLTKGFTVEQALVYGLDTTVLPTYQLCIAKPDNKATINVDTLLVPMGLFQYMNFLHMLYCIYDTDMNLFIKDKIVYVNNWNKTDPFGMEDKEDTQYTVTVNVSTTQEHNLYGLNDTERMIMTRQEYTRYDYNYMSRGGKDIVSNTGIKPLDFAEITDTNDISIYNTGAERHMEVSQGDLVILSLKLESMVLQGVNPTTNFVVNIMNKAKDYRVKSYTELITQDGGNCGVELFTYNEKKDIE